MIPRKRRIKKAKYNGVSFYIEDDETCGGRRIVTHEFPFSETSATEDLGKRAKQWQIQGFVGGALYKQEAEKLQDALEQPCVGVLDHPYIGKNKKVRCPSYRRCETNREWGVVWFSMTFSEAGELPQIAVASIADQVQKNQSFLETVFTTVATATSTASGALSEAADSIDAFSEQLEDALAPFVALREGLGDVMTSLTQLKEVSREILSEPTALLNALTATLDFLVKSPMDSLSLISALGSSISPIFESMSSQAEDKPFPSQTTEEVTRLSESLATVTVIQMSTIATRNDIQNTKDRERVKTLFLSSCDQFLEQSNSYFEIIQSIRSETYFTLQRQDEERNVKLIHTRGDTNLLLLSYELYGDVSKSPSLAEMNPDLDPSFVSKGTPVEAA